MGTGGALKVAADVGRAVGIRADDDGKSSLGEEGHEFLTRVLFARGVAQPGGIDFQNGSGINGRFDHGLIIPSQISRRAVPEFFHEVGVGAKIEAPRADALFIGGEIRLPDLLDRLFLPSA